MSEESLLKTPEEIKKGLETCIGECTGNKPHCPYHKCGNGCMDTMNKDSLAYIKQLESDNESKQKRISELESRLAQVERERDAAVCDLRYLAKNEEGNWACDICNVNGPLQCTLCNNNMHNGFEWRGVCEKNTKESDSNARS